jgi:two-component system cell cycle response regulator DivK
MENMPTVLYVEDNLENRLLIRRVLMAEGIKMLEAGNANQALQIVHTQIPDLILMDINLPEMDGYTLTAQIKALPGLTHTPIIALTANVMKGDREKTLDAGCDGYIQKPIDVDILPLQVNQFLREGRRG